MGNCCAWADRIPCAAVQPVYQQVPAWAGPRANGVQATGAQGQAGMHGQARIGGMQAMPAVEEVALPLSVETVQAQS